MAVVPNRIAVDSSAAKRLDATPDAQMVVGAKSREGYFTAVKNMGPDSAYIGGADTVTDTTGYEFPPGSEMFFTMFGDDQIWARCAATKTANIQALQVGV